MSMDGLNPAYGVPYMNKTRRSKNPMDILQRIVDQKDGASDEEIRQAFADRIIKDEDMTHMCLKAYCVNLLTSLRRIQPAETIEKRRSEREAAAVERTIKVQKAVKQVNHWFAETVFGLTFGEVAKMARAQPQLLKIAAMGNPKQRVSDVLSLAQLQKMLPK